MNRSEERNPERSLRSELPPVALLLTLITLLFSDILFLGQGFYLRDVMVYAEPVKMVLRHLLLSGQVPFWNPLYAAGQPLAANPAYETFYPPQLLILLPDFQFGFQLQIVLHFYLAAIGMYLLARSFALSRTTAIIGGFTFAAGGPMLSQANLLPILYAWSWIPLILFFVHLHQLQKQRLHFVVTAILLGVQATIGEPVSMLQTWAMIGAYLVYSSTGFRVSRWRGLWRATLLTGALVLCGLLVGAIQFLPMLDFTRDTVRAHGFSFAAVADWSMPPARLTELLLPFSFGHQPLGEGPFWGTSFLYPTERVPFTASLYSGLLVFLLLPAAMRKHDRVSILLLAAALLFFMASFGAHTPLLRFLYDAGLVGGLRFPEKFALPGVFALLLCALPQLDAVLRGDRLTIRVTVATAALLSLIVIILCAPQVLRFSAQQFGVDGNSVLQFSRVVRSDLLQTLIKLLFLGMLFAVRSRVSAGVASALLIVFTAGDLLPLRFEIAPAIPRSLYSAGAPPEELQPTLTRGRLFHEAEWHDDSPLALMYASNVRPSELMRRNAMIPRVPNSYGLSSVFERDVDRTLLWETDELITAMWKVKASGQAQWRVPFLDMSNVAAVTAYRPFVSEMTRAGGDPTRVRPIALIPLRQPSPRFYIAGSVQQIGDTSEFVSRLSTRPHNIGTVFIHGTSFRPARAVVTDIVETASSARMRVVSEGKTFLAISVTPHRYWRARLDGLEIPLIVSNIGFQGVVIPAGRHHFSMRYFNPVIPFGAGISALTLLALLLWLKFEVKVVLRPGAGVEGPE